MHLVSTCSTNLYALVEGDLLANVIQAMTEIATPRFERLRNGTNIVQVVTAKRIDEKLSWASANFH